MTPPVRACADRQVLVLLTFDPATGAATLPVGAVGVHGDRHHLSWVPLEPAADEWRTRLQPSRRYSMREAVEFWAEHANGVAVAIQPIEAGAGGSLVDAVETVVDALLVHRGQVSAGGQ
ncbi:MAG: hypothetical protein WD250_08570 [Egibacteraceae bacterium]